MSEPFWGPFGPDRDVEGHGYEPPLDEESDPIWCPFCSGINITTHLVEWPARSSEDPDNTAALSEHQCRDCGRSFWS